MQLALHSKVKPENEAYLLEVFDTLSIQVEKVLSIPHQKLTLRIYMAYTTRPIVKSNLNMLVQNSEGKFRYSMPAIQVEDCNASLNAA